MSLLKYFYFIFIIFFLSEAPASGLCESLFVEKSYDQMITQPTGTQRVLYSKVNGKKTKFNVFYERETEARIVFSSEAYIPQTIKPVTERYSVALPVRASEWNGQRSVEDVVDSLIYSTRNDKLSFKPLSSIFDNFHGKRLDSHSELSFSNVEPGALNKYLVKVLDRVESNSALDNRSPIAYTHDRIEVKYLVGSQRESSIYYDTPSRWLEQRGFTARVKSWYEANESNNLVKRVLTIKKPLAKQNKGFHDRSEISVVLKDNMSGKEISDLILSVLKQSEESINLHEGFVPVVQVNNLRHGLDLKLGEQKVGFVVIDNFVSQKVDSNLSPIGAPTKPQFQMEIEVLSDRYSQNSYQQNRRQFNELLQKLIALIPTSRLTEESKKQLSLNILENNYRPRWNQKIKPDFIALSENTYLVNKHNLRPYAVWTSNKRVQKAAPLELNNGQLIVKDGYLYFKPLKGSRVRIGKRGHLFKDGTIDVYDPNQTFGQTERMNKFFPIKGKEKFFNDLVNSALLNLNNN